MTLVEIFYDIIYISEFGTYALHCVLKSVYKLLTAHNK